MRASVLLLVLGTVTLFACGGTEAIQEGAVEHFIEATSGDKVDIELTKEGSTATGPDGTVMVAREGSATVPEGFPVTFPSDAKVTSTVGATGQQTLITVNFESATKPKDIGAIWEKELTDKGYTVTLADMTGRSRPGQDVFVGGEKDKEVVSCSAIEENGKTVGAVTRAGK